jgi:hypothetical protein
VCCRGIAGGCGYNVNGVFCSYNIRDNACRNCKCYRRNSPVKKKIKREKSNKTLAIIGASLVAAVGVVIAVPGIIYGGFVVGNVIDTTEQKQTLSYAIGQKDIDRGRFLLENGADPNELATNSGETILFDAVRRVMHTGSSGMEIIELLLIHGAEI